MINDVKTEPLGKSSVYRKGKMYCELWGKEISVLLYDEDVTLEYAEKCAEALNSMPQELVHDICQAAKKYCLESFADMDESWKKALNLAVPVNEDTLPADMMKCFSPTAMVVGSPKDPAKIGYQLDCICDWEEEHGMEIDILDNKLVYLSSYNGESPWEDHSDEPWNYAARVVDR